MRCLKFILFLSITMTLTISLLAQSTEQVYNEDSDDDDENSGSDSLRGVSRFLAQKRPTHRFTLTRCNKYPRICHVRGSPGPDCCRKRCVDVRKDRNNCGRCGKKCKYSEICCKGKCVNPLRHKKHCGRCNNNCGNGSTCTYGMCSYAN